MTDKQHEDQNIDALRKAFERLNVNDELQTPTDLDAMILQQAAEEVGISVKSSSQSSAELTENSNVSDLSFRRSRIRSDQDKLKQKSWLPSWAMPIGLAATVLVSFGVVTRVMDSPEFKDIGMQSAPVFDDKFIVTDQTSDDVVLTLEKPSAMPAKLAREKNENKDLAVSGLNQPPPPKLDSMQSPELKTKTVLNAAPVASDIALAGNEVSNVGFAAGATDEAEYRQSIEKQRIEIDSIEATKRNRAQDSDEALNVERFESIAADVASDNEIVEIGDGTNAPLSKENLASPASVNIPQRSAQVEATIPAEPEADVQMAPQELEEFAQAKPVVYEEQILDANSPIDVTEPKVDDTIQEVSIIGSRARTDSSLAKDSAESIAVATEESLASPDMQEVIVMATKKIRLVD